MSKKKRDRDKEQEQDRELEIPDSMQEEMFAHQFLRDLGADEKETIAYVKILNKMVKEIVGEMSARIDERMRTQNLIISWGVAIISTLIAIVGIIVAIGTFKGG